jgi:DNA replication protein DnaC
MDTISISFQKLHMPGMSSCWKTLNETHQADKLSLSDGLELLLQSELDNRRNNRIDRLIKNAGLKQQASIEELETSESRGIPAGAITQLATGEYLKNSATIVISGPTGTGKSFLACALGERACRLGYKVKYYTVNRLLDELKLARLEGHELKFFEKIEHLDLLIIDDFGMKKLEGQQQNDFEQIIDDRYHKKSLILSSQLAVADWYGVFNNEMLAEACLDRIAHKSLRFELKGDSMRKKY